MQEADPQKEDQAASLAKARADPLSPLVPRLEGLSDLDSVRLSEFVHQDFSTVCHIVTALCGPQIDVDGAVAEATARAVEQLAAGRSIDAMTAWVTRVAVNLGRSEIRRQAVRRRKASLVALPTHTDAGIDLVASRVDMQRALRGLSARQAEVVALYYGLDLSVVNIARTLGRSEGTVKATLSKARLTLARLLGPTPEDGDDGTA